MHRVCPITCSLYCLCMHNTTPFAVFCEVGRVEIIIESNHPCLLACVRADVLAQACWLAGLLLVSFDAGLTVAVIDLLFVAQRSSATPNACCTSDSNLPVYGLSNDFKV